ncbi:LysR family transcriptional regulator [Arthrobacter ginkgonis]|uniref:LysR family transcriptional regulator n=1 Tax=Arthrobacter ginkgonis TaxID=1630594 RepID=A0ABP7C990_9MICC
MDLTTHHLRCFLAVARELHFGRAAASLHLSPSSLSGQVSALERRLGRPLFQRSSRSVELTEFGRGLLPLAEKAVSAFQEVLDWAGAEAAAPSLRVGLMVSSPKFRDIMAAAAERMPDVQWQIRQLGFLDCHAALERGDIDCAFVAEVGDVPVPDVDALPLWEEDCVLVVSENHPLAGRAGVRLAEIAGETFLSVEDKAASARWYSRIGSAGPEPRVLRTARNFEEILEMCGAGLGVNIAGASAPQTYSRPGLGFVPIVDAPPATTFLYLPRGPRPAALARFAQLAAEIAAPAPS